MSLAAHTKAAKPLPKAAPTLTRLTAREAGELLGVSDVTIYAMARAGKLPAVPIGIRGWRFLKEPLEEWLQQHLTRGLEGRSNG